MNRREFLPAGLAPPAAAAENDPVACSLARGPCGCREQSASAGSGGSVARLAEPENGIALGISLDVEDLVANAADRDFAAIDGRRRQVCQPHKQDGEESSASRAG